MPYSQYIKKIKDKFGPDSKQFVVASIYKEATFRDDIASLIVVNDKRSMNITDNFLLAPRAARGNMTVINQAYKTQAKYGVITVPLSASLSKTLQAYIIKTGVVDGGKLFPGNKTLSSYVSIMNKAVDPNAKGGINYLRHSVVSEQLSKLKNISAEERVKLARQMGHSPLCQLAYVRSIEK
jgi:hypothetical protein